MSTSTRGNSFQDELYKLKLIASQRTASAPTQVQQLNQIFDEIASLDKQAALIHLSSTISRQLLIVQSSLNNTESNTNISTSDQSLILETFLHNTLLLLLQNKLSLHQQRVSPVIFFIQSLLSTPKSLDLAIKHSDNNSSENKLSLIEQLLRARGPHSQLFNLLMKSMEVLRISTVLGFKLIQQELNSTSTNNLPEITLTVLPIAEYLLSMRGQVSNKVDLSLLRASISAICNSNTTLEIGAALRLLSCLSRLELGQSSEIAVDLAEAILSSCNDKYDMKLTESEMSVLITAVGQLHPLSRKITRCVTSLLFDYETKIERMLTNTIFFDAARVPSILTTLATGSMSKYRPAHRKAQVASYTCVALLGIANKNAHSYLPFEIASIILASRSLLQLAEDSEPVRSVEQLYLTYFKSLRQNNPRISSIKQQNKLSRKHNIKMQRIRNTSEEFASMRLQDFLRLFIGMRVSPNARNRTSPDRIAVDEIHRELLLVVFARYFKQKKKDVSLQNADNIIEEDEDDANAIDLDFSQYNQVTACIQILYEVAYNHNEILDSAMFEDHVSHWIAELSNGKLSQLSNHDLIALGFVMRKFARLFGYHIDFWMRFAAEVVQTQRASVSTAVEVQRIRQVITGMLDFYRKCLLYPPTQFKNDLTRIAHLNLVTNTLAHTLDFDPQHEQTEYDI